ncbi:MAG: AsnC family transcriptional regulator [Methanoregula sp.]|uniref:Lrp/AsnC family transcriptional regulator n=1 Tax=Methanoregula sp. TaxID=2052170 RepID=UPI003BB0E9BC
MTAPVIRDQVDLRILDALQDDIPLVDRPYAVIASRVGIAEHELLERLMKLKEEGVLRGISPVLESRKMGLSAATLVALHVPEDNVRKVAAIISSCPEVSHNFRRDHYYTLWFTISAENDERVGQVLAGILDQAGVPAKDHLNLPTVKKLKIDVRFPFLPSHGKVD